MSRILFSLMMIVLVVEPNGMARLQTQELQSVFAGLSLTTDLLPQKSEYGTRFKAMEPSDIPPEMKYSGTIHLQITADGKISGSYETVDIQEIPGHTHKHRIVATGQFTGEKSFRASSLGKPFQGSQKIQTGGVELLANGTGVTTSYDEDYSEVSKRWESHVRRESHRCRVEMFFPYSAGRSTWNVGPGPATGPLRGFLGYYGDGKPPLPVGWRVFSYLPAGTVTAPAAEAPEPAAETPVPPTVKPACDMDSELGLLKQAIDKVIALESEAMNAASELAVQHHLIERTSLLIKEAVEEWTHPPERSVFATPEQSDVGRLVIADRIREARQSHERIYRDQDRIIGKITGQYRVLAVHLQKKAHDLECPDVRKAFFSLWTYVGDSWDRAEIQMYFVSGQREKFRALARERLGKKKDEGEIHWLLGQDYLRTGEIAPALYSYREVEKMLKVMMARFPQGKVPKELSDVGVNIENSLRLLEVAFMETVDRKVLGEAAAVRALLEEELGLVEGGGLWDILNMGLAGSYAGFGWGTGRSMVERRAREAGYIMEEAAAQHVGFTIIMRLRAKNHLLSEIKAADRGTLVRWVADGFSGRVLSNRQADNMLDLIVQGFKNPDMVRLMSGTLEEFESFPGRPYYDLEQFRCTWAESLTDFATNPLVVFSIFAPFAKLGSIGKFMASSLAVGKITNAEAAASETFLQFMSRTFQAPRLLARTTASNTMLGRQVQNMIAWNREASLMKKVFVSGLVQTGAVEAATALGGLPGRVVAEVLTGLGVGDFDEAVKILRNSGVSESAAEELAQGMRKLLDESTVLRTQAQVVAHRNRLAQLIGELEVKKALPDAVKSELLQAAQRLEDLVRAKTDDVAGDLARIQLDQIDLTSRACRTLAEGDFATTRFLVSVIDDADEQIIKTARKLQEAIPIAEASRPLKAKPTPEPQIDGEAGRMANAADGANKATAADKAGKHVSTIWIQHDDFYKAADDALKEGISKNDVSAALAHYKAALTTLDDRLEEAVASGDAERVKKALRDVRLAIDSHAVARDVSEALPHIKPFGKLDEDNIVKEFADHEITAVRTQLEGLFEQIRGQVRDKPSIIDELMPPLRTSSGEKTLDQPRLLVVNGDRFVVKDFTENLDKAKNELVASRLANKLEINSPACAEISWVDEAGNKRCVLVQRFVPNASDLGKVDRGTALALKKHIAEDRVLAMWLGDHDRRSRNFLVTAEGRVYAIDRGESVIIEFMGVKWDGGPEEDIPKQIITALKRRHDVYRGRMEEMWPIIEAIDHFITSGDMEDILGRISRLSEKDLSELLKGVFVEGSKEYKQVKTTLLTRRGELRNLLMEPFRMDSRFTPGRPAILSPIWDFVKPAGGWVAQAYPGFSAVFWLPRQSEAFQG